VTRTRQHRRCNRRLKLPLYIARTRVDTDFLDLDYRIWNILAALRETGLIALGDKGYHGYDPTGRHVITPYKGRNKPESQKDANRAHARLRGPCERANAQLKAWNILRKLRCCPRRAGRLAKAIHVLQNYEVPQDEKGSLCLPKQSACRCFHRQADCLASGAWILEFGLHPIDHSAQPRSATGFAAIRRKGVTPVSAVARSPWCSNRR
jgi:hypothetical protein